MCNCATPINYLRYELSDNGVSSSADKVKAIKNYPTPRSPKEVRAFLGLASFYRRLVPNFAVSEASDEINPEEPRVRMGAESARSV